MLINLPNARTLIRFLLIGVYVFLYFNEGLAYNELWAFAVFILAGLTDVLDGYIARRNNQVTKWGKLMDPLADKLMMITVLVCLFIDHVVPTWAMAVIVLKELLMILGAAFLYKNRKVVVQSNFYGKLATVLFYIAIAALVFELPHARYLLWLAIASTIISFLQYAFSSFREVRGKEGGMEGRNSRGKSKNRGKSAGSRKTGGSRKQDAEIWDGPREKELPGKAEPPEKPLEQFTGNGD